jgi:hypothetical protein
MKQNQLFTKYFQLNTWLVFLIVYGIYAVSLVIELNYLFTDEFYFNALSGSDKSASDIISFIKADRAQDWINYPFAILIILVPTIGATIAIYLGSVTSSDKACLKDIFKISLKSQIVFAISYLAGILLKLLGIVQISPANINDRFGYQSLLMFFNTSRLPRWSIFPLQSINISELLFMLVLAVGFAAIAKYAYPKALGRVALYYGLGLLFWIIAVAFIQIVL